MLCAIVCCFLDKSYHPKETPYGDKPKSWPKHPVRDRFIMKPIQQEILDQLRQDSINSPEAFTTKYIEYCFTKVIFPEHEFIWASQQPPSGNNPNDTRGDYGRMDYACDHYSPKRNWPLSRRIIYQGKRGDCTYGELSTCEQQATNDCMAYCGNTEKQSLWAITGFTSYIRIWAYRYGNDYLTPFYPGGNNLADKGQYVDLPSIPMGIWETLKSNHEVPHGVFSQNLPSNDDSTLQAEAGTSNSAPSWDYTTAGPSGTYYPPMPPMDVDDDAGSSAPSWNVAPPPDPETSMHDTAGPPGISYPPMPPPETPTDDMNIDDVGASDTDPPDAPTVEAPPGAASKGKGRRKPEIPVVVREEKHMTTPDVWCFTDVKGKPRRTEKKHWKKKVIDGHERLVYEGERTVYYKVKEKEMRALEIQTRR